jgi:hypothetical protein
VTSDPTPGSDRRARDRFAILAGLRVGGIALMLLGLWSGLGGSVAGIYGIGTILMVGGVIGALVVPALLARRWRSPR